MLNFIRAEFFRSKRSKLIKGILIAGIFIPALLLFSLEDNFIEAIRKYPEASFVSTMIPLMFFGANVLSIVIIFVGKSQDSYRLLLSQGLSKFQIVLYDFVFYNVLVLALGLFMALIVLIINGVLNYIIGVEIFRGLGVFMKSFFYVYHTQVAVNSLIFLLAHAFASPILGYLGHYFFYVFLVGFWTTLVTKVSPLLKKVFYLIFPLTDFINPEPLTRNFLSLRFFVWALVLPLGAIYLSYKIFARREL